jgi:hypothetical protein
MGVIENINWIAIILCGVSTVVLGMLWYSPLMFYKAWAADGGITPERAKTLSMPKAAISTVILGMFAAFVMATFIPPGSGALHGISYGFRAGLFFVGAFTAINYIWSLRTVRMTLIDAGYQTVQFTIYGALIGWLQ